MTEALFGMLFVLLVATLVASGISYECDLATLPEQLREIGRRVCRLEVQCRQLFSHFFFSPFLMPQNSNFSQP